MTRNHAEPMQGQRGMNQSVDQKVEGKRIECSALDPRLVPREFRAGSLILVGTPIGNLGDLSQRAIETLKAADLIAAEDTRRTKILLDRYGLRAPLTSYHAYNAKAAGPRLIERIQRGVCVALVTDAGMPGISDPGTLLVRLALDAGVTVSAVPGPSAFVMALVLSGLPTHRFVFEGFLPAKSGARRKRLEALADDDRTLIFYESPHRLVRMLADALATLGDRPASISRELTKQFEETRRGRLGELLRQCQPAKLLGEFVIVIAGKNSF